MALASISLNLKVSNSNCHRRCDIFIFIGFAFLYISVQVSIPSNTYVVSGSVENKRLEEMMPGILTQLGEESMPYMRSYAERAGALAPQMGGGAFGAAAAAAADEDEDDDDQVPELVENFEEAAAK